MTENLTYHTPDELQKMTLAQLQALWELVPTDRQRTYKSAYEREVKTANAYGSDELERQVAQALLERYTDSALVPVGERWVKTPSRLQESAKQNLPQEDDSDSAPKSPKLILMGGLFALVLLFFLFSRGNEAKITDDLPETPTLTPTLEQTPTATPLALEAQDDVIRGGDSARAVAYPVNLQIVLPDGANRVWVVQRRAVQASEWRYDPNPDTASFINGMTVRPVIGIPHTPETAHLFAQIAPDSTFILTMNTGAVLRYRFAEQRPVRRSETEFFRQIRPSLALVLIGETDADGLPTATRPLILAEYDAEQERSRDGETGLLPEPTPTPTPLPAPRLAVQIIEISAQQATLTTRFRLQNLGTEARLITPDDLALTLGYAPNPLGARQTALTLTPFALAPMQTADLTLIWAYRDEPHATLDLAGFRYAVELE